MKKGPIRRLLLGSGANGLGIVARLSEQLLLIPIFISSWSLELYGEWLLLSAIPVYLSQADFGFVSAGSNELAKRTKDGSSRSAIPFYSDYFSIFSTWSIVIFLVFVLICINIPLQSFFSFTEISQIDAQTILVVLIGDALLGQVSLTLHAGLRACRVLHLGLFLRAMATFLRIFITLVVVAGFEMEAVKLAYSFIIARVVLILFQYYFLKKHSFVPRVRLFQKPVERMWPVLALGLELILLPLSDALLLQGMVMTVGVALGPVAVVVFATHRTLARTTAQLLRLVFSPLRAETTLLQNKEDQAYLTKLVMSVTRLSFWMSIVITGPLLLLGSIIFEKWTNGAMTFQMPLFSLLIAGAMLEGIWRIAASIRLGNNKHRPITLSYFVLSVMAIALTLVFTSSVGINTLGYITFCLALIMLFVSMGFNRRTFQMTIKQQLLEMLRFPKNEINWILDRIKYSR